MTDPHLVNTCQRSAVAAKPGGKRLCQAVAGEPWEPRWEPQGEPRCEPRRELQCDIYRCQRNPVAATPLGKRLSAAFALSRCELQSEPQREVQSEPQRELQNEVQCEVLCGPGKAHRNGLSGLSRPVNVLSDNVKRGGAAETARPRLTRFEAHERFPGYVGR
jgi:hypothetical protein